VVLHRQRPLRRRPGRLPVHRLAQLKARVQNGLYAGAVDANDAKTFLGSIGLTPDRQGPGSTSSASSARNPPPSTSPAAPSSPAQVRLENSTPDSSSTTSTSKPPTATIPSSGPSAPGSGTTSPPRSASAVRAEYLDDPDGAGLKGITLPGRPGSAIVSSDADGAITSVALTSTSGPSRAIKIQPELRYDHTAYEGGFDGEEDRFVIGAGVTYSF
jgi:hypothetical protein